jgi:hypothetical protein
MILFNFIVISFIRNIRVPCQPYFLQDQPVYLRKNCQPAHFGRSARAGRSKILTQPSIYVKISIFVRLRPAASPICGIKPGGHEEADSCRVKLTDAAEKNEMRKNKEKKTDSLGMSGTFRLSKADRRFGVYLKEGQTLVVSLKTDVSPGYMYVRLFSRRRVLKSSGPVSYGMMGVLRQTAVSAGKYTIRVSGVEGEFELTYHIINP